MRANEQDKYQRWLAQINQVCGSFAARPMTGEFYGELDATWTGNLKLSTVTAGGVNLFRTRQEIKNSNDAWFYTVFQLEGEAGLEQDDRQIVLNAGDITLIDASRPCSIYWPEKSRQISLLLPRQILEQHFRFQEVSCAQKLSHSLPTVQAQLPSAAGQHEQPGIKRNRKRSRAGGDGLPVAPGVAAAGKRAAAQGASVH